MDIGNKLFLARWVEEELKPKITDPLFMAKHLPLLKVATDRAREDSAGKDNEDKVTAICHMMAVMVASVVLDAIGIDVPGNTGSN